MGAFMPKNSTYLNRFGRVKTPFFQIAKRHNFSIL